MLITHPCDRNINKMYIYVYYRHQQDKKEASTDITKFSFAFISTLGEK